MKRLSLPIRESDSYLVKFRKDDELYGMYVWAIDVDEAKSQVRYHMGDVTFIEVTRERPER